MRQPLSRGSAHIELQVGYAPLASEPRQETPFCIALLGDFSGRAGRESPRSADELALSRLLAVDRDNFDEILARFAPQLTLPITGPGSSLLAVRFANLEDFHPDALYSRLPVFAALRDLRRRLADPRTFAAAARELTDASPVAAGAGGAASAAAAESPRKPRPGPGSGSLLDQVLDESGAPPAPVSAPIPATAAAGPADDLQSYIRQIMAPHLVASPDPRQPEMLAQVDTAIGQLVADILHHPAFQALESLWRAIFLLVRRLETDQQLRLYLVDVTQEELRQDLLGPTEDSNAVHASALFRCLTHGSATALGGAPWALLIGLYGFGTRTDDTTLLGRVAQLAAAAGAPWISAAEPALAGVDSFESPPEPAEWTADPAGVWESLRRSPEARFLGLALPRFLLRSPYGADAEPCEAFDFEEMASPPRHEHYLWGNAAIIPALLVGQAFSASGWQLLPGMRSQVGGLPLHLFREDGETVAKPCAECLLTERAASHLMDGGFMAVASMKGQDAVRLVRFQSIAHPVAGLAGRWRS
jgi:type VI secretion system protein ImpC